MENHCYTRKLYFYTGLFFKGELNHTEVAVYSF